MNRAQILSRLRKLLGNKAAYQVNPNAPDADERAALSTQIIVLRAARDQAKTQTDERRAQVLADPHYRALVEAYQQADRTLRSASARLHTERIRVGTVSEVSGLSFHNIQVTGDSWDEVFAKLKGAAK